MVRDGTYPPLDTPKPVAPGVWVVDSGPQRVLGLPFPVRMTVLRLEDGGLWLHSPTRHSPGLAAALAECGPVRHLLAPGTAHWTHLPGWQAAFPEARLWAAPGVAERARRQGAALRVDGVLAEAPPPDWAGEIEQAVLSGPGFVEVAFHHRPSHSLVLTDSIQAMEPARLPFAMRLLVRALGVAGPEGGTPIQLRLLLGRRRAANRAAAARLLALAPERVIFAHGAFYAADGKAQLRRAWGWLLD
ncbi:DUF4336 domain-containing protein [Siccirubricoccus sp. G192]|uniref:DUF4336 domain-containing protein n=1 Tax=Siccirubricoccus sp. G192 TaxID=2849651 RepID=UPI001C2CB24B|nr:DUF4336 domain-containing protein [Siccirubricoccus sp. G192]MBV1797362.1 DUF4336 domain-containing protein [Siccirubricoccus sp. G192]